MVINESSSATREGFSDDAPDSDRDPYSSLESSNSTIKLDTSKLPQPFPILGPMFGYNGQLLSKLVNKRIEAVVKLLDRPATEDEATAIAYWTAKQIAVTSWGTPLGIAAGAWRAYQTASTFRFPFFNPQPDTFRALEWPSARVALLSGPRAVAAWHASRLLAYVLMGSFFSRTLLASYGVSVSTVGEIADPRLKNYVEAIRKVAQSRQGRLPNDSQKQGMVGGVQEKDATTIRRERIGEIGDNASPDIEKYGDTKSSESPAIIEDAVMPDSNTKTPEAVTRASRGAYPKDSNAGGFQPDKQPLSLDESFGYASPTGGKDTEDTVAAEESAWDRIRRQASGQPAGNRGPNKPTGQVQQAPRPEQRAWRRDNQRRPREEPIPEGSILYTKSGEETQQARDEAQKEFDARVEQERKGGDFSAGNGNQKRW